MNSKTLAIILQILVTICVTNCNAQRTKDKMYEPINGISPCFRRMNGTHQTGCSSDKDGTTGIVHFISSTEDLQSIIKFNNSLSYIPVLPVKKLTKEFADAIRSSNKFSGLVVYEHPGDERLSYSHEDSCPNRLSNLEGTCKTEWNKPGTGLLLEDLKMPIFYVKEQEDIKKIRDCFVKFNNFSFEEHMERSLCAIELTGFMFATLNTPTCIRRSSKFNLNLNPIKYCDAMGDQNVWASLFPIAESKVPLKYIIVSARLDTTSLFHELAPGAESPISGLVTFLASAEYLKRILPKNENYDTNILFVLFNGESYDYIGSQRIVYDMERGEFPTVSFKSEVDGQTMPNIRLDDVSLFLEISQIGKTEGLFAHFIQDNAEIRNFLTIFNKHFELSESTGKLPPASLQTFLKARSNISGLVLANHGVSYTNQFYNSLYDDTNNLGFTYVNSTEISKGFEPKSVQVYVEKIASAFGKSLFETITTKHYEGVEKADINLINELFHCYLENANCTVHQAIQRRQFKQVPLSLYVGVTVSLNILTSLVGLTLAWVTGDRVPSQNGSCSMNLTSDIYKYFNMSESLTELNVTKCYKVSMNFTEALSPAFLIEDYDWSSGKYSSWSESVWRDFNVRLFLQPSRTHEIMTFVVGFVTFLLSLALVYSLQYKSDVLFRSNEVSPASC